jgi:predicted anti-sigma-YlaC factor YlaD
MMTCKEVTDRVTDYLDGRVPHGKRIGMWLHLVMCERCRMYLDQIRTVIDLSGQLSSAPTPEVPGDVRESLLEEFRRRQATGDADPSDS